MKRRQMVAYPTVRRLIRTLSMQENQAHFKLTNRLYQGKILDRIIVGMVRKEASNGNVAFDPFCFQKFGLTSIKQIVIGEDLRETFQRNHDDSQRDLAGYFFYLQASKRT